MKRKLGKSIFAVIGIMIMATVGIATMSACGKAKFDENKNISVVTREDGSGTKSAFMEIIGLKGKADIDDVIIGQGTAGILAEVKSNPQALAYESLGYVTDEVKMIKVNGVEATIANIKNGTYKIARPLQIVYKQATIDSGINKAFYDYLMSSNAQEIISREGYVSTKDSAKAYSAQSGLSGKITVSGSTSLQPLMIILADEFEKLQGGVEVAVSGGGSGTGYKNAQGSISNFGMISEVFNTEKAPDCVNTEVAKDGIAIIVHKSNTKENITTEELKNIYNCEQEAESKIKTWSQIK